MSIYSRQFYHQNLPKMVVRFEEILEKTEGKEWDCIKILANETKGNHNPIMFTCWNKVCFDAERMQKGEFYEISYEIESKILKTYWQTIITAKKIKRVFINETEVEPVIEEKEPEILENKIEKILSEIQNKMQIFREKFLF